MRFQWNGVWELYNVQSDRTEQHDFSATQPERVKELSAMWYTWTKQDNVLPEVRVKFPHGGTPPLREPAAGPRGHSTSEE